MCSRWSIASAFALIHRFRALAGIPSCGELCRNAACGRDRCSMSKLSIVMPVLDEGEGIVATLDALADLRALGTEVIVVDGGSRDATIQRARPRADRVILAPRGRALQMNAG